MEKGRDRRFHSDHEPFGSRKYLETFSGRISRENEFPLISNSVRFYLGYGAPSPNSVGHRVAFALPGRDTRSKSPATRAETILLVFGR
jgi:hypothetical protein